MRKKIGVLLMEELTGEVGVQVFEDPDKAADSFKELKGRTGEQRRRATFLRLEFNEDGSVGCVHGEGKYLPVPVGEIPDGYVIGEGPRRT